MGTSVSPWSTGGGAVVQTDMLVHDGSQARVYTRPLIQLNLGRFCLKITLITP
jgi:hypothetical protein